MEFAETVKIVNEELSDGSFVHNLMIKTDEGNFVNIPCEDQRAANRLYNSILTYTLVTKMDNELPYSLKVQKTLL